MQRDEEYLGRKTAEGPNLQYALAGSESLDPGILRLLYLPVNMKKIFWFFGSFNSANGLWMLFAPRSWFYGLPAAVPDTGPLNVHFVRDVGAAFLTIGLAFCFAAPRAERHRGVIFAAAAFYVLHALIHVFDLFSGRLHAHHWLLDLPGVFLPAMVLVVLCATRWWPKQNGPGFPNF